MERARQLNVERQRNLDREISIYDKLGGGYISLNIEEAEYVRDRLDALLDDDEKEKPEFDAQTAFKGGP